MLGSWLRGQLGGVAGRSKWTAYLCHPQGGGYGRTRVRSVQLHAHHGPNPDDRQQQYRDLVGCQPDTPHTFTTAHEIFVAPT